MPSKRQKKAGYLLPSPVVGWPLLDVCLKIPNAPEYRRAFIGHLNQLGLWANWEKSYLPGDVRARDAAELWRETLNKYLEMDCFMPCCDEPQQLRINPDGSTSVSTDGGTTWTPNLDDPRTTAVQLPPPATAPGDATKCKAANNVLQQMQDAQAAFAANLGTGATLLQLALAIAGIVALVLFTTGAAAFLVPIVLELAGGIVTLSAAAYNALFTTEVWQYVLCQLYCNIGEDGIFTQGNFNDISANLDSHFTGNLALSFSGTLQGWQLNGLNNAARIPGASNLDCSACDCGGCDVGKWILFDDFVGAGQTISYGADYVEVPSYHASNGTSYVILHTGDISNCCQVDHFEFISGSTDASFGYTNCNNAVDEYSPAHPAPNLGYGGCINHVYMTSNTNFTVRIFFVPC